eukprot:GEMP01038907.1.p1 GENE.GEMP01038907.1~~GEMP01038907.1.p1  ORF type:complete len:364 (+),score=140.39 GEMP01038907.1:318-1409(+)
MEEARAALDELGRSRAFVAKLEALVQELHNQRRDDQAEFHAREEGLQRRIKELEHEWRGEKGSSDRVHKLHCEEVFHLTSQLEEAQRLAALRQKAFEQLSRELKMVLRQKITAESHLVLLQRNVTEEGGPGDSQADVVRLRARVEDLEEELRMHKMGGAAGEFPDPPKHFSDNRVDQRVPMLEAELERERREADIQLNRVAEEKARMEKEMLLRMELMEREINHLRKWNDTLAANAPSTRDGRPSGPPDTSQAVYAASGPRHVLEGGRVTFKEDVERDDYHSNLSAIPSRGSYNDAPAWSALGDVHMRPGARPSPRDAGASRAMGTMDMPPLRAKPKAAMDPEDAWRELDNVKHRIDRMLGRL